MLARAVPDPQPFIVGLRRGGGQLRVGRDRPALLQNVELAVDRRKLKATSRRKSGGVRRPVGQELGVDPDLAPVDRPHHHREPLQIARRGVRNDVHVLRGAHRPMHAHGEAADQHEIDPALDKRTQDRVRIEMIGRQRFRHG